MAELTAWEALAARHWVRMGVNPDTAVVQSQPFGALIDSQTRKVFIPDLPKGQEYETAHAIRFLVRQYKENGYVG